MNSKYKLYAGREYFSNFDELMLHVESAMQDNFKGEFDSIDEAYRFVDNCNELAYQSAVEDREYLSWAYVTLNNQIVSKELF